MYALCSSETKVKSGLLLLFLHITLFGTADMSARQKGSTSLNIACTRINGFAEEAAEAPRHHQLYVL